MRFLLVAVAVGLLVAPGAGWAADTHGFVKNASIGGQFEVSSSRLALQNTQNPDVRGFAQEMLDDHTQIANHLKQIIAAEHPDQNQPTMALDSKHRKMLDKLRGKKNAPFDALYVEDQAAAHAEAIKLFQDYADNGDNPALKDFAAETLPTLQQHQAHLQQLQDASVK